MTGQDLSWEREKILGSRQQDKGRPNRSTDSFRPNSEYPIYDIGQDDVYVMHSQNDSIWCKELVT